MNREELVLALCDKLNVVCGTIEELLELLNEMFVDRCDEFDDMQIAFNDLNDDIGDDLLANYFCYCVSDGGEWEIEMDAIVDEDNLINDIIKVFKKKGVNVETKDDLLSHIAHKVMDTESNVGCDVYTALTLEIEDFPNGYEWEDLIKVSVPDGNPCLKLVDDLF